MSFTFLLMITYDNHISNPFTAKYLSKSSPPCMHSSADFIHLHEFHGGKKPETVPGPAIGRTLRRGKNLRPHFGWGKIWKNAVETQF